MATVQGRICSARCPCCSVPNGSKRETHERCTHPSKSREFQNDVSTNLAQVLEALYALLHGSRKRTIRSRELLRETWPKIRHSLRGLLTV